ncbi:TetR family transcriptional regulator [uncultured Actinomyces sp.]|uniref:TetR/AcrR family transcriptional regulator n=1 Tax=uncultured Actinomyces sp. TaxID=249061 RepID=UPI00262F53A2|nr:TetR family transcriptional regulator [uncultured Actinomyces sp.]
MTPRGRRPAGSPDARAAILVAARAAFAREGYRASLRGVARDAGVDPALVHHYFPDREQLFVEAVISTAAGAPVALAQRAEFVRTLPAQGVGAALVRLFVSLWDEMGADRFMAVVHAALENELIINPVRDFVVTAVLGPLTRRLSPDRPALRAQLVATQLIGLGIARWGARMGEIAALDVEGLAALVGPAIERYVLGDLP